MECSHKEGEKKILSLLLKKIPFRRIRLVKKKDKKLLIIIILLVIAIILINQKTGFLSRLAEPCETGSFLFKNINTTYVVCPKTGDSILVCGSYQGATPDRWVGINHKLIYDENIITVNSKIFQYDCGTNTVISGYQELLFDIDVSFVERIDFEGNIKVSAKCDKHRDCSSGSFMIGIKDSSGNKNVIYTNPYYCVGNSAEYPKSCYGQVSFTDFSLIRSSRGWVFKDLEGHGNTIETNINEGTLFLSLSTNGVKDSTGEMISMSLHNIIIKGEDEEEGEEDEFICDEGEKQYYVCSDGSNVHWCTCLSNSWSCINNPSSQCSEEDENETGGYEEEVCLTIISCMYNPYQKEYRVFTGCDYSLALEQGWNPTNIRIDDCLEKEEEIVEESPFQELVDFWYEQELDQVWIKYKWYIIIIGALLLGYLIFEKGESKGLFQRRRRR